MTVYVDPLMNHGWLMRGRTVPNCHLFADTLEELHAFALRIGMKIEWFQHHSRLPHYDLTSDRRAWAVRMGAKEVSRRELVLFMRNGRFPQEFA